MTNKERISKYKAYHCVNCMNKDEPPEKDMCNIRIFRQNGMVYTKCSNYVKNDIEICLKTECRRCFNFYKCFKDGRAK